MAERGVSSPPPGGAPPPEVAKPGQSSRSYRNSDYPTKLLKSLHDLRKDEHLCDLELYSSLDSPPILANKNIVAAATPYFHAMFTSGLMESEERQYRGPDRMRARQKLVLQGIQFSVLQNLVDFMYTGEMKLDQSCVQEILVAADMIQLKEVVDICSEFLKTELHESNAIGIWRFAEGHNLVALRDFAISFIYNNFCAVAREEEFLELSKDYYYCFFYVTETEKKQSNCS